jgi:hypothetical protein
MARRWITVAVAIGALALAAAPAGAKPSTSCGGLTVRHRTYTVWEHNNGCTFARNAAKLYLTTGRAATGYRCNKSPAGSNVPFFCVAKIRTRDTRQYYAIRR